MAQVLQGTGDELLRPRRGRVVARLLLVSAATFCSLGLMTALAVLFEHVANVPQSVASSTGQVSVSGYPLTIVPSSALPSLPKMPLGAQRLVINGQAQVAGGLVLVPSSLPSVPLAGELYYDQSTNQPYFYNGTSFISLQPTAPAAAVAGSTTVIQQITNTTTGTMLSGLTANGVVYATGPSSVATLASSPNGVLVTDAAGHPAIAQALPAAVQGNIIATGSLTSGSIGQGFGTINTSNAISTTAMLQAGGIIVGADGASQPASMTVRGGAAAGIDAVGADTIFDAGNGTGNGGSGALIFRTAASNALPVTLGDATEFEAYTQPSMSTTFAVASHSNTVMVVGVNQQDNTQSVTSISWNGSSAGWTKIGSQASAGGVVELWYLVNPASGSHTLTVNFSATSGNNHQFVGAETFYNVNQTAPVANSATGTATTTGTTSVTLATSLGQVAIDVIGDNQFCLGAPGSGQTRTWADQLGPNTILGGSYKMAATGTTTMSWGANSACTWESVAAVLSPIPGTTSDTLVDRLHISATGNVGIDNSNPQYALDVTGVGNFSTSVLAPVLDTASAATLNIGTTNATQVNLEQNTTVAANKSLIANGAVTFKDATNSAAAFQVQNATGANLLTVDTSNTAIVLGNDGTPSALTVRGGAATGTDAQGSNITFDASNGTGGGGSGDLIFQTAAASGGVSFDTTTTANQDTFSSTLSWSHTATTNNNRAILVSFIEGSGDAVQSVTYGTATLSLISSSLCASSTCKVELWGTASGVPSGANTVTATWTSARNHRTAGAMTFYNVNTSSPFSAAATPVTGSASPASITASSTTTQQVVVDAFGFAGGATWVPGSGQVQAVNQNNATNGTIYNSYKTGSASSTALSWTTGSATNWGHLAVAINAAANASADTLADRLHISASGNIGISNSSPQYTFDVAGTARVQTTTNSTTAFQVQNASGTALLVADTTNMRLTVTSLIISTQLTINGHIVTGGTTPGIAAGAAACTAPTVAIAGNDTAGQVMITTGSSCSVAGTLATITFSTAYASAPRVQLTPDSAAAAGLLPYKVSTTTGFTVDTSNTPASATAYTFDYLVTQ